MKIHWLSFCFLNLVFFPSVLFGQPTVQTINPQYLQQEVPWVNQKLSINFYEGDWINGNPVFRYQDRVSKCISSLPDFAKNATNLTIGCDTSGRYWAINPSSNSSLLNGILYDYLENRVLYQAKGFFRVSPAANSLVIDTGLQEGGGYPTSSLYQIPSLQEIISNQERFSFLKFISDRYVLGVFPNKEIKVNGIKAYQAVMVDLITTQKSYSSSNYRNVPRSDMYVKIPGKNEVLVLGGEKDSNSMVIKSFPNFETIQQLSELNPGIPFTNSDGSIIGSVGSYKANFLNRQTKEVKSFSFSLGGDDVFMEFSKKQRPQTVIHVGGKMEIKNVMDDEINHWTDLSTMKTFSNKEHPYGADKPNQKMTNGERIGHDFQIHASQVVWDQAKGGFWILFVKQYYKTDLPQRKSSLIFIDTNFDVKKINSYPQCQITDLWLDSETGTPMAVDEKHRKMKISQE